MNNIINNFFSLLKEQKTIDKNDNVIKDLYYRKIMKYLRKHSSNTGDDYQLRLLLQRLFYYDINGIPISILKPVDEIYKNDNYPFYFKNKTREEIIDIYNNEVRSKYFIKIYNEEELNNYDIKPNIYLDISLKTFRPVYNENWKKISEEVNEVSIEKQKSFYADYLKLYLKLKYFPSFDEYIKFIYIKYQMPVHKDIRIVFDNIDKSYKDVRDYINNNNMTYEEVRNIIIQSTQISKRILMENNQ